MGNLYVIPCGAYGLHGPILTIPGVFVACLYRITCVHMACSSPSPPTRPRNPRITNHRALCSLPRYLRLRLACCEALPTSWAFISGLKISGSYDHAPAAHTPGERRGCWSADRTVYCVEYVPLALLSSPPGQDVPCIQEWVAIRGCERGGGSRSTHHQNA